MNHDRYKSGMNCVLVVVPEIVPNSRKSFEGEQAQEYSIRCSARGKPDPKYTFFKVVEPNMSVAELCHLRFIFYHYYFMW